MTTEEFRRRRDEIIRSRPPWEQAKLEFAMRRLGRTQALLNDVLAIDPNQPEALLTHGPDFTALTFDLSAMLADDRKSTGS